MIVGWMIPCRMDSRQATDSRAPAAPKEWPIMDLVALTGMLYACSPNVFLIANVSELSLSRAVFASAYNWFHLP